MVLIIRYQILTLNGRSQKKYLKSQLYSQGNYLGFCFNILSFIIQGLYSHFTWNLEPAESDDVLTRFIFNLDVFLSFF